VTKSCPSTLYIEAAAWYPTPASELGKERCFTARELTFVQGSSGSRRDYRPKAVLAKHIEIEVSGKEWVNLPPYSGLSGTAKPPVQ
jgi:hypothetical protein